MYYFPQKKSDIYYSYNYSVGEQRQWLLGAGRKKIGQAGSGCIWIEGTHTHTHTPSPTCNPIENKIGIVKNNL